MKLSAALLSRSSAFRWTLVVLLSANVWSWLRHQWSPPCCDQEVTAGFPFPFYISGGTDAGAEFYVLGLLLDVVLALTLAVLFAWIANLFHKSD